MLPLDAGFHVLRAALVPDFHPPTALTLPAPPDATITSTAPERMT